ncbi:hypothetical protein [Streptomyces sp. H27-D2]|uniref:hypothetical protein n=1 Tax=Streptomyces sp. H27-D2 TaxID=3046304 RepID=UPI002DB5E515|nr:hypothetical protein [Streptomyces sp. H27-D2]
MSRSQIAFATGMAAPVSGKRWFRDTERNDIQHELPGWPEGARFAVRTKPEPRARKAARFGLRSLFVLIVGGLETLAGSGSIVDGGSSVPRRPEEPANEVEDFPVMWGARGTIARTLPWQLDPGRCSKDFRTHAIVTDRRVLILAYSDPNSPQDEVLWEIERSLIDKVEEKKYSKDGTDVTVQFTDGSWCRFSASGSNPFWTLPRYLAHTVELISPGELAPGQKLAVSSLAARHSIVAKPVVTRRPSGNYLIDFPTEETSEQPKGGWSVFKAMGSGGEDVRFKPGDF